MEHPQDLIPLQKVASALDQYHWEVEKDTSGSGKSPNTWETLETRDSMVPHPALLPMSPKELFQPLRARLQKLKQPHQVLPPSMLRNSIPVDI